MRIIDEWTTNDMRVTVFHMNGRYSLKLESMLLEQTYKFRDGVVNNLVELKQMLTDEFYKDCHHTFIQMDLQRSKILPSTNDNSGFVEII